MRSKVGYGYTPQKPRFTDRNGRPSIDDFPLVPEPPQNIHSHPLASNLSEHPANTTEGEPVPQPNPPQPQPEIPVVRELQVQLRPPEAIEPEPSESASGEAASLLSRLHATDRCAPPARPARRRPPPKKRRKKARARKSRLVATQSASSAPRDHHERHCTICNHAERDAVEEEFLHWINPWDIARHYGVEWRAIYRHAHARGLFAARERNLRFALAHIVEQATSVNPTTDGVLRAIRAYSCLNSDGQWVEPPAHVIVSSGSQIPSPQAIAAAAITVNVPQQAQQPALPSAANPSPAKTSELLDNVKQVEIDVTR
ncbi:MAG TPA: hypothetical protein VEJ46_10180 [Candidatus Acidoferrum sp.]|nr:hypothetical protein [Candidatus Acidoferrum sp.]